jgi:hypothetical protein
MSRSQILAGSNARAVRESDPAPAVPLAANWPITCVACGGNLTFLPYGYPFAFGCGQGHFLTLQALLDVFLPQARHPELSTLECWERKALLLRLLAQRALEVGHVFTAADFQEVAVRIDHWVATLRRMIPLTESEALLTT